MSLLTLPLDVRIRPWLSIFKSKAGDEVDRSMVLKMVPVETSKKAIWSRVAATSESKLLEYANAVTPLSFRRFSAEEQHWSLVFLGFFNL